MGNAHQYLALGMTVLSGILWGVAHGQNDYCPYVIEVVDPLNRAASFHSRYLQVTITRTGPNAVAKSDQTYNLVMRGASLYSMNQSYTIGLIRIPAGQKSGSIELYTTFVQGRFNYQSQTIFVDLNGDMQANGSFEVEIWVPFTLNQPSSAVDLRASVLFVSEKSICDLPIHVMEVNGISVPVRTATSTRTIALVQLPNATDLCRILRKQQFVFAPPAHIEAILDPSRPLSDVHHATLIKEVEKLHALHLDQLPSQWQGLAPIHLVVISASDWRRLMRSRPTKWKAISHWVQMGGRLVIVNGGDLTEMAREWDAILGTGDERMRTPWMFLRGVPWETIATEIQSDDWFKADQSTWLRALTFDRSQGETLLGSAPESQWLSMANGEERVEHAFANWGLGRIVLAAPDSCDFTAGHWTQVLAAAWWNCRAASPAETLGVMSLAELSPQLKVPGVGEPPYTVFLFLITAFAVLIGPGLYLALARWRRLSLMAFFVPLISLGASTALLAYAILVDGFAFRAVRISGSYLDAQNGIMVTQTKYGVFSGRHPGEYRFPTDVHVLESRRPRTPAFRINDAAGVILRGGTVRGRTHHQVSLAHVAPTTLRVAVTREPGDASFTPAWWLQTNIGQPVRLAFVATDDGLFFATEIGEGRVRLQPLTSPEQFDELVRPHQLAHWNSAPNRSDYEDFGELYSPSPRLADTIRLGIAHTWADIIHDKLDRLSRALKTGEFLLICDDFDGAWRLREKEKVVYSYQRHFIHGRW